MYRYCLLLALVYLSAAATAQIFGPVAVPVEERKTRPEDDGKWLAVEASAGANLITRRRLLREFDTVEGLTPGVGSRAGIKFMVLPESNVRLVLSLDYLQDRGTLKGYHKENNSFFSGNIDGVAQRERTGEVTISENWWRGALGLGFRLGPLNALVAFHASGIISGSQQYDYTETINAIFEPVTGQAIPLTPALVRTGSRDFFRASNDIFRDSNGGYGGLYFELSYPFTERLRLQLEYEQGWHLDVNGGRYEEWRQRRSRMGLTVAYRVFSLERQR